MRAIKKIFIINAFIAGWLISVCAWAEPIIVRPANPVVNVRLESNPSTGYQWVLMQYDSNLMEKPTSTYEPPSTQLIGAPGHIVWHFKFKPTAFAVSQKTTVVLEYKRPWEKTPGTSQSIQILIKTE